MIPIWIKNIFNKLFRELWELIKLILSGVKGEILAQLKNIAVKVVQELNDTDLSNEQKRKEAFKRIAEYANQEGIQAKDHLINLAIELALAYLKAKVGI